MVYDEEEEWEVVSDWLRSRAASEMESLIRLLIGCHPRGWWRGQSELCGMTANTIPLLI